MIAVAQLVIAPKVDQLRAQRGNEIAIKAFKEGTIPFPDGSSSPRFIGLVFRRKSTTAPWTVHFPARNLLLLGCP
jgi:hypothetical protein